MMLKAPRPEELFRRVLSKTPSPVLRTLRWTRV